MMIDDYIKTDITSHSVDNLSSLLKNVGKNVHVAPLNIEGPIWLVCSTWCSTKVSSSNADDLRAKFSTKGCVMGVFWAEHKSN